MAEQKRLAVYLGGAHLAFTQPAWVPVLSASCLDKHVCLGDYLNSDSLKQAGAPYRTKPQTADLGFAMQMRQEAALPCRAPGPPRCSRSRCGQAEPGGSSKQLLRGLLQRGVRLWDGSMAFQATKGWYLR